MNALGVIIGGPIALAGFYFLAIEGFSGTSVGLSAVGLLLLVVDFFEKNKTNI